MSKDIVHNCVHKCPLHDDSKLNSTCNGYSHICAKQKNSQAKREAYVRQNAEFYNIYPIPPLDKPFPFPQQSHKSTHVVRARRELCTTTTTTTTTLQHKLQFNRMVNTEVANQEDKSTKRANLYPPLFKHKLLSSVVETNEKKDSTTTKKHGIILQSTSGDQIKVSTSVAVLSDLIKHQLVEQTTSNYCDRPIVIKLTNVETKYLKIMIAFMTFRTTTNVITEKELFDQIFDDPEIELIGVLRVAQYMSIKPLVKMMFMGFANMIQNCTDESVISEAIGEREWVRYFTQEDETLNKISSKPGYPCVENLLKYNREAFPTLKRNSRLLTGTSIWIRPRYQVQHHLNLNSKFAKILTLQHATKRFNIVSSRLRTANDVEILKLYCKSYWYCNDENLVWEWVCILQEHKKLRVGELMSDEELEDLEDDEIHHTGEMDSKSIRALCEALRLMSDIESLNFAVGSATSYILTQQDLEILCKVLSGQNQAIVELNLNGMNVQDKGVIALSELISKSKTLKVLRLDGCRVCDTGMKKLGAALQHNNTLKTLMFGCSRQDCLSEQGLGYLCEALRKNSTLRTLYLNTAWPKKLIAAWKTHNRGDGSLCVRSLL